MNRAALKLAALCVTVGLWASCGGGNSSSGNTTTPITGIADRVFITNAFTGSMEIVNAKDNLVSASSITIGGSPQRIYPTPNLRHMLVYDANFNSAAFVNADTEDRNSKIPLPSWSDSLAIKPDGSTGYAALRNVSTPPGVIAVLDAATNAITSFINVASVRWIFIDNGGKRLLAFSDLSNTAYSVDLTATTPTATALTGTFDHPIYALFSSDDSNAYILSCGSECGGSAASVVEYTFATNATRSVAVDAATIATLQGSTLYVAGAPGGTGGRLTTVDVAGMTKTTAVDIGAGFHQVMKFADSKVWVGAKNCNGGCLSVYTPGGAVVVDTQTAPNPQLGDVTGMTFVASQNRMWVCEGGEVNIYDSNLQVLSPQPFDVVGQAYDVINPPAAVK